MIGRQDRKQGTLFIAGSLADLIPDDHILKRLDKVPELSCFAGLWQDHVRLILMARLK